MTNKSSKNKIQQQNQNKRLLAARTTTNKKNIQTKIKKIKKKLTKQSENCT